MAKFGFMSKALAGAGQGLQLAGQIGFQAKLQSDLEAQRSALLAKRDEVLQRYEGGRLDKDIAARASEGALDRATRKEGFITQKAAHLEGIDKQLQAKDNKVDFKDGVAFLNGVPNEELTKSASALSKQYGTTKTTDLLQNMQGLVDKQVAKNYGEAFNMLKPKGESEGLPKTTKDTDDRIKMYKSFVTDYLGVDFLAKLDPEMRPKYTKLLTEGADQVRNNIDPEKAFRAQVEALDRLEERVSTPGDGNTKAQEFRKRFGY